MEEFAIWLKEKMDANDLDNAKLARRMNMAPSTIGRILHLDSRPGRIFFERIDKALGTYPGTAFTVASTGKPPSSQISDDRAALHYDVDNIPEKDIGKIRRLIKAVIENDEPPDEAASKPITYPSRSKRPARSALKDK